MGQSSSVQLGEKEDTHFLMRNIITFVSMSDMNGD